MNIPLKELDFQNAVPYHYDSFPPKKIDYEKLIHPITAAASALARYDQMLKGMHNSEILLAPLRSQEAVISSRMEGTISTLDEVLQYEADQDDDGGEYAGYRSEAVEVFLYGRALKRA
ncbi:MAG: Fic/DOC family N-terminal domain-containing protein, partial [Alphaproteobacteria bacterium]